MKLGRTICVNLARIKDMSIFFIDWFVFVFCRFSLTGYERNLLMTMQMASSGSSVCLGPNGRTGSLASVDSFNDERDYHKIFSDCPANMNSRSVSTLTKVSKDNMKV